MMLLRPVRLGLAWVGCLVFLPTAGAAALAPMPGKARVVGVAGSAVLAGAVVVALHCWVTRPTRALTVWAERGGRGTAPGFGLLRGPDELKRLGAALTRMAGQLQARVRELEAERARTGAVLGSMAEGVVALDAPGRVLLVNPAAREILGLGSEPVEGRALVETVRQTAVLELVEAGRAGRLGATYRRELELGPPLGRVVEARGARVEFGPGTTGQVLVLHDITELRRLERVRREFVANVSHELRTPLTSIQGYLETLLDGAVGDVEGARRFLEVAHRQARRLARLVQDLLDLSELETGRVVLTLRPVGVSAAAEDVVDMFRERAAARGLALLNRVPPGLRVRADPDRLVQILVNLVDNALKYTPRGGRVTLDAGPAPEGTVEIRVTDTGIGIPSADLGRVTERFYRVDRARSGDLGGSGLGLAIVSHLVQVHGGSLRIESEVGRGTTVRVALPGP